LNDLFAGFLVDNFHRQAPTPSEFLLPKRISPRKRSARCNRSTWGGSHGDLRGPSSAQTGQSSDWKDNFLKRSKTVGAKGAGYIIIDFEHYIYW